MFERLFTYPAAIRRHSEGPFATERAKYLKGLVGQGMAPGTVLRCARYCLCVAKELQRWPPDHSFNDEEIQALASAWATVRVADNRATGPKWPTENFRPVALGFLRAIGRLRSRPPPEPSLYEDKLADFVATQQEGRWLSEVTCSSARWQITRFLEYLDQRNVGLEEVGPSDVDAYFEHMAQRWGRVSLRTAAKFLRSWFVHCEARAWTKPGLADAILMPRIYRHEGLPLGPTWKEVDHILTETNGDTPAQLRDHAILLLLSVYGLRSGEVRRLQLDDIYWQKDRIRVTRSKSGREETLPIEPRVGNAIARYLRHGRPKSNSRVLFLTLKAPHRPLSGGALYGIVQRQLSKVESSRKGRGPHALRHACARHLVESGRSFKEVGDHLGHRSPEATRVYAKVDLKSLRRVAFDDLGGLA